LRRNNIPARNRSVEEPDQPDGTLSKRKSLTPRRSEGASIAPLQ